MNRDVNDGSAVPASTARASLHARTIDIMSLLVDDVDENEVVERVIRAAQDQRGGWLVNPNVDVLRQIVRDPELRALVGTADLVVADGMPLVWASRVQGTPLRERVPGAQLIWTLSERAARAGLGIFLLGGAPGVAGEAAQKLTAAIPSLRITGTHCPPFGFERDDDEMQAIHAALQLAEPNIVFCGLGFPKQERLMAQLAPAFPATWFIGSGASLTFAAGVVPRAPAWMQRSGLEWVHRLGTEPRRLFTRYVVHDIPFALRMLASSAWSRTRFDHPSTMTFGGDPR